MAFYNTIWLLIKREFWIYNAKSLSEDFNASNPLLNVNVAKVSTSTSKTVLILNGKKCIHIFVFLPLVNFGSATSEAEIAQLKDTYCVFKIFNIRKKINIIIKFSFIN